MPDHKLLLSLTVSAWLAAAAAAQESIPPYPALPEDHTGGLEAIAESTHVTDSVSYNVNQGPPYSRAYSSNSQGYEETWWSRFKTHCWDHWGYPAEELPVPFGSSFRPAQQAQIMNGIAAEMVLYNYDFGQPRIDRDPQRLIAHGQLRLMKMQARLAAAPCPLIIETTGDPSLDAARRHFVLAELNKTMPVPPESVVIGVPRARGVRGVEAEIINTNLMNQTRARGLSQLPSQPGKILSPILAAPPDVNDPDSSR